MTWILTAIVVIKFSQLFPHVFHLELTYIASIGIELQLLFQIYFFLKIHFHILNN